MSHKVKKKIDKAIGKRKLFTDDDRRAIYAKMKRDSERNPIRRRNKKIPVISAYALATALLFVFGWIGVQNHFGKSAYQNNKTLSVQSAGQEQHRDQMRNDKSFRNYVNVFLGKKHPAQFRIVKKMYYSLDYIHNVQGEFVWGHPTHGDKEHEWFHVDFDNKKSRSKREDLKDGKVIQTMNVLFKNEMLVSELPAKHIFVKRSVKPTYTLMYLLKVGGLITETSRFSLITDDYSQWHYQTGTKFGMPVYEIKGVDRLGRHFAMTVSKDTGVLLGLKMYEKNNKNKLTFYITVKNIKINRGIPSDVFHLDVFGDKELPWGKYISKTHGAHVFRGKKICGQHCTESHPK